jgi:hypothetical protein
VVDDAESGVAIALGIADDAHGKQVVNLIEAAFLANQFAMERVKSLDARFEFGGNAVLDEAGANGVLDVFEKALVDGLFFGDFFLQGEVSVRLEEAESEIFEFALDDGHAEAMGDGGVDVHGLARDALLLDGRKEFQGAHVVEAVCELDQDDANVVDHGEKHFADVFGLARFRSHHVQAADLGDTFNEVSNFRAETFFQAG